MTMDSNADTSETNIQRIVRLAKEQVAARTLAKAPSFGAQVIATAQAKVDRATGLVLNEKQQSAVDKAVTGASFCLIGSAGVGKTTSTKAIISAMLQSNKIPMLERGTKMLSKDTPGIALIAYTRRAVRNIAKQMSEDFKKHCMTYHSLVEYEPEEVETAMPDGSVKVTKPFLPQRNKANTLPTNLRVIFIDEASMFSTDFFRILCEALPDPSAVQFIFIGDINQLPPIYGDGILGLQMNRLPTIELTEVYRQALESPIIKWALAIKDNNLPKEFAALTKEYVEETAKGKVTFRPWKRKVDMEEGMFQMNTLLTSWVDADFIDFNEDVILCAWGKKFGTIEMNKSVASAIAKKHGREVFEIIAGFNKHYFSVGDKVLIEKMDAEVIKIAKNVRYLGKPPQPASSTMNYWGWGGTGSSLHDDMSADDLLDLYSDMGEVTDRVAQASHAMTVKFLDSGVEKTINGASEFNSTELAYCMSVHKAQGSEWKRVFFISHECHSKMMLRELVYTAFTRASQELYVIMPPTMLKQAAARAKIKGDTLADKILWFKKRLEEKGLFGGDSEEE